MVPNIALYLRIASYLVVAWAAWVVNDWRHDAAGRTADRAAADRRIEAVDQVRVQEREDAKTADKVDENHAAAQDQVVAQAQPNTALSAGINAAAERVRSARNAPAGNTVAGTAGTAGRTQGRSADADRADRCEALLAEGVGLVAEGGELLQRTAFDHDRAAAYAIAGHEWAVRKP